MRHRLNKLSILMREQRKTSLFLLETMKDLLATSLKIQVEVILTSLMLDRNSWVISPMSKSHYKISRITSSLTRQCVKMLMMKDQSVDNNSDRREKQPSSSTGIKRAVKAIEKPLDCWVALANMISPKSQSTNLSLKTIWRRSNLPRSMETTSIR